MLLTENTSFTKNRDVDGWECIGIYDYELNNANIYVFSTGITEWYQGKDTYIPNAMFSFSNSKDQKQYGRNDYQFLGLVDENIYNEYGFALNEKDIHVKELDTVKVKK